MVGERKGQLRFDSREGCSGAGWVSHDSGGEKLGFFGSLLRTCVPSISDPVVKIYCARSIWAWPADGPDAAISPSMPANSRRVRRLSTSNNQVVADVSDQAPASPDQMVLQAGL